MVIEHCIGHVKSMGLQMDMFNTYMTHIRDVYLSCIITLSHCIVVDFTFKATCWGCCIVIKDICKRRTKCRWTVALPQDMIKEH